ncbi:hypothetical protein FOZ61_011045, partial [Perkinsus olseni]
MATPPNQDTAVASTSTGAPVNMVENPGLTDEEVASFLEFLELDDVQIVQWIESHEIEAAFNKAKLPLGKKASYRKVFNTLHRPLPHREPTPSPSNPANAFNQQTSTTTTAPSQCPVFSQSTPSAQAVTMEPNDTDIYAYLDKLESAVAMCQSVGLFLQPSQVNIHYRQGLNSTLRAIADQHYPAIDDVQLLTQSLRSHVRRNPDLFKQATTNSKPTTTTTTTKSVQPSTTGGSSTTKLPLVRVEDPTTIKLCKEQGICLAWTARKQCRHGDSCKYKHAEVVRRIACGMEDPQRAQLPTRTTTSMVLRSPLLA